MTGRREERQGWRRTDSLSKALGCSSAAEKGMLVGLRGENEGADYWGCDDNAGVV